jgi:uncharacterized 2Fe-2S/4Fe-4S cluster protein (DUF4445 family)
MAHTKKNLGIAVDLGTTTIAAALYVLETGERLALQSALNRQARFGPDVISRIRYCEGMPDGLGEMHKTTATQLTEMIVDICNRANREADGIKHAVIAGNTVMLHILRKLSPVRMGAAPYKAESLFDETLLLSDLGIPINARCYLPPCISAFVGADVTVGMSAVRFGQEGKKELYLDVGTNGEIAFSDGKRVMAASTAAGPAFEGRHISCGMGGAPGAIERIFVRDGVWKWETIGDGEAAGICGSGLIDAVAVFLEKGYIDRTGRIVGENNPFLVETGGQRALRICEGVFLSQADIREFQTAKAAIAAGLEVSAAASKTHYDAIDVLYLAGGFGVRIDTGNAMKTGLVPAGMKIMSTGNLALEGAVKILLDIRYAEYAKHIAKRARTLNLSGNRLFDKAYIDHMSF